MADPMLMPPDLTEYRWALYCRSHLFGLSDKPEPPVAIYRDEQVARAHGGRLWPSTWIVVDLHKDELP
ncbi:MAG: hypothetical protein RSG92_17555 [Pseudomonas sp.]